MTNHHYDDNRKKWIYDFGKAQWVIDDVFLDIANYFQESLPTTMRKCQIGASRVQKLWECEAPLTDDDRFRFYQNTDAHIYEGANWHADYPAPLQRHAIAEKCYGDVLVLGCGIGTEGLFALYNDRVSNVVFMDVPNSKILDFVNHRITRHRPLLPIGKNAMIYGIRLGVQNIPGTYDTIICMDVLEHLENPQKIVNQISECFNDSSGQLLVDAPFADISPFGHLKTNKDVGLEQLLKNAQIPNYEINLLRPQEYKSGACRTHQTT